VHLGTLTGSTLVNDCPARPYTVGHTVLFRHKVLWAILPGPKFLLLSDMVFVEGATPAQVVELFRLSTTASRGTRVPAPSVFGLVRIEPQLQQLKTRQPCIQDARVAQIIAQQLTMPLSSPLSSRVVSSPAFATPMSSSTTSRASSPASATPSSSPLVYSSSASSSATESTRFSPGCVFESEDQDTDGRDDEDVIERFFIIGIHANKQQRQRKIDLLVFFFKKKIKKLFFLHVFFSFFFFSWFFFFFFFFFFFLFRRQHANR
jgi:hypothetical protein